MPTIDTPPDPDRPLAYRDWSPETTRIALVPLAHYETWEEALVYFEHRYGRVFQNCSTARWWAARVARNQRV